MNLSIAERFTWIAERLTFKSLYRRALHYIDRCRGLDFLSVIEPEEVGLDQNIAYRSSSSGDKYLLKVLKDMKITNKDSVIDMGCGQGSAMRTMLKFPFKQVDGVELSQHIGQIAIRNFDRLKVKRCTVSICDASSFKVMIDIIISIFIIHFLPRLCLKLSAVYLSLLGHLAKRF